MTVVLDASALAATLVDGAQRAAVLAALADDPEWCACALALTEAIAVIDRLTDEAVLRIDAEDELRRLWDYIHVVPVDAACLDRASELARAQPLRTPDAIHLAAADRLPRPIRYVTFDPNQITVALSLGYDVVST